METIKSLQQILEFYDLGNTHNFDKPGGIKMDPNNLGKLR